MMGISGRHGSQMMAKWSGTMEFYECPDSEKGISESQLTKEVHHF
jgi:hypothetical protein